MEEIPVKITRSMGTNARLLRGGSTNHVENNLHQQYLSHHFYGYTRVGKMLQISQKRHLKVRQSFMYLRSISQLVFEASLELLCRHKVVEEVLDMQIILTIAYYHGSNTTITLVNCFLIHIIGVS